MSNGKKVTLKNTAAGARGVHDIDGVLHMIEKGESATLVLTEAELNDAKAGGSFEVGGKAKAAAADDDAGGEGGEGGDGGEPGPLDQSVDKLTEYLAGVNDADEIQQLINAETAGKSRVGALAALEERLEAVLNA